MSRSEKTVGVAPKVRQRGWFGAVSRFAVPMALLMPTIVAIFYYGFFAANRYLSEAQFVVRTASKPVGLGSFNALMQMTGFGTSGDSSYAVQSFLTSRDAVRQMMERLPLAQIYGRPEADRFAAYPSLIYGSTIDQFHSYLGWMIRATHSSTSAITTLKVQAFRPEDAKAVADELLALGEMTVNKMNERIQQDAIRASLAEVREFENRLVEAQIAITRFRNAELMIDPLSSSIVMTELIAGLSAEKAKLEAQAREALASAPNSPVLSTLRNRIAALDAQILQERARIADRSGGLAQQLARYERLVLDREFAKTALTTAAKGLENARTEGRRQQLYLERVVTPNLPDYPMHSDRYRMIWTVLSLNLIALLVGWLFYSGIVQHRAGRQAG